MEFTAGQLEQFRAEGYVVVPDFWNAREVRAMQLELERLGNAGMIPNVTTEGDGVTPSQNKANLQIIPIFDKSEFFRAMPFAVKAIRAISQLIGDPFLLHLDQAFVKPGRHGIGTHWHQDNAYFKIRDPLMGTAMWSAVHDATLANGTMRIIPGSFREQYEHSRDPYSNAHIRCYPPEERAIAIEVPAGGVLFFCYGTAHETGPNNTDRERAGVALHFLRSDFAQDELIDASRETRPYLTGPQATGGLREYGAMVAGTWEAAVERVLGEQ